MARQVRDARIQTPDARAKLKMAHEPYWRTLHQGLALGYRKGKRGGVWIARKLEGKRYVKQVLARADDLEPADGETVLDFKAAQQRAFAFGESERVQARRHDPTVATLMQEYIEHQRAHRKSPEKTWNKIARHVLPELGELRASALTSSQIRRWHAALATKPSGRARADLDSEDAKRRRKVSANRVLTIFKAAMNFAHQQGLVEHDDAWRRVEPFRGVERARIRFLSIEEARRLVEKTDADFRPLVRAALLSGGRYGELVALCAEDFNADAGTLHIRESKSGHARHVPLSEEGQAFFAAQAEELEPGQLIFTRGDGAPWGASHQIRRMSAACTAAKITPAVSFHDLRRTYGSFLAKEGVPLLVIAAVLGHRDTRITERHYAHLLPSHVAMEVRANLPRLDGKPKAKKKPADVAPEQEAAP